jgi:hypothetical protein
MASINGGIYLIIGAIIAIVSWIIKSQNPNRSTVMLIFFFIGILFILIGFVKLFFSKLDKKQREIDIHNINVVNKTHAKPEHQTAHSGHTQHTQHQTHSKEQNLNERFPYKGFGAPQHQQQNHPKIINCPMCGTRNYTVSNFCHGCGYKLK